LEVAWNRTRENGKIFDMSFLRQRVFLALAIMALFFHACREAPRNFIIFCAGDSITEQGYPRPLGILLKKNGVKAKIFNFGQSGNTSAEYLGFVKANLGKIGAAFPDIVLIELGTNDVRLDGDRVPKEAFERNLRELITIFSGLATRTGSRPALYLATIPPIPEGTVFPFGPESRRRVTEEINPAIRRIAEESGIVLVDNHEVFRAAPSLLPGVHPSPEGYQAMAKNWYGAIRIRLGR
jgi:lysophospholipase L1-like esterase